MDKDEFERLKAEEKAHLRQLRALKQQHREVQRKKNVLDALGNITRPDLTDTHDEMRGKVTQAAARQEARLDLAMEDAEAAENARAQREADREALQTAEAEQLVRQMKSDLTAGEVSGTAASRSAEATPAGSDKTIGRVPPDSGETPEEDPRESAKTIGRPRRNG